VRLLRSWPAVVPPGRAHVVDGVERLVMTDYDYRVLADVDDDVLLLEWDIAVAREDLAVFAARAAAEPDRVLVAPYRLYISGREGERELPAPVWTHRRFTSPHSMRFVTPADPTCHLFGLGMVYLPRPLVLGFLDFLAGMSAERTFDDGTFSQWHYSRVRRDVPVVWDASPVHLHYPTVTL
jgi:hypothetical protein